MGGREESFGSLVELALPPTKWGYWPASHENPGTGENGEFPDVSNCCCCCCCSEEPGLRPALVVEFLFFLKNPSVTLKGKQSSSNRGFAPRGRRRGWHWGGGGRGFHGAGEGVGTPGLLPEVP